MTVHNGAKFLSQTLDSIFAQTFTDFELIVVNNRSTDDTLEILNTYTDTRLKIIEQTKEKPTFGDGIRLAYANVSGEYIAVNDGDDVSFPDRFKYQIAALQEDRNLGLVSGWFEEIDESANHISNFHPPINIAILIETFQTSNPLAHSTYMYRKMASDEVGGYSEKFQYGTDFALVIAMLQSRWSVKIIPKKILQIRVHDAQASLVPELSVVRTKEVVELFKEVSKISGLTERAKLLGQRNLVKRHIQYGFALIHKGNSCSGVREITTSLSLKPIYSSAYLAIFLFRFIKSSLSRKFV